MKQSLTGIHITAEWYDAKNALLFHPDIEAKITSLVVESDLTPVSRLFHDFGSGGGYTGMVLLAESHLSIHTWPELNGLTLDIYVCNFSTDNTDKAKKLLSLLSAFYQPAIDNYQIIQRGNKHHLKLTQEVAPGFDISITASDILETGKTNYQTYSFVDTECFGRTMIIDGVFMTSEVDEHIYHTTLVNPHINYKCRETLLIGGGDGGAAAEILKNKEARIDWVEIDGEILKKSEQWLPKIHKGSMNDPRVSITIDDAYQFIHQTNKKYDAIYLDLTDPWEGGELSFPLHSNDGYRRLSHLLTPDGVLSLHIGSPIFHASHCEKKIESLKTIFSKVYLKDVSIPTYGGLWRFVYCSNDNLRLENYA